MARFTISVLLLLSVIGSMTLTSGFLDDASNSDVSVVKIRLSEEKSKRLLIQNDVETLMRKIEDMERKIKKLIENLPQTDQTVSNTTVYFNAKLSAHTTLDSLHVLVFDTVRDNFGECYSASTGIFRAPVTGLYQFSLSILSNSKGKYAHIQLMRNVHEIGRIFAGDVVAAYGQMGSITVTTLLTEGDEVYSREFLGNTGYAHGDSYCSFSGVLLAV